MNNVIFQYMITGDDCDSRGPIKEIPNRSRSAVYREVADLSAHSFKKYANKLGATHHYSKKQVTTAGISGHTVLLFEVLRLVYDEMYDEFDNLLFADTDIVCNTEEDIFEMHVQSGKDVSGIMESSIHISRGMNGDKLEYPYASWDAADPQYELICSKYKRLGYPVVPVEEEGVNPSRVHIMNTGVHVWTREARLKARKLFDPWLDYMKDGEEHKDPFWLNNDQPYLSAQLVKHGLSINHINQTWNDSPPHYRRWEDWKDQNFLHYTGGFGKKHFLADYDAGHFKYI